MRRRTMTLKSRIALFSFVFAALLVARPYALSSQAADALPPEVRRLQTKWEAIKFGVPEGDDQSNQMNALGEDADAVAAHFPAMPEALIWDGIITSERASMASTFYALGFAKRARDILEQAVKLAPNGLDALYFYGDFLYTQNELPKAVEVFQHALKIPQHPDRPLWDKNRRLVIEEDLAKIEEKR